MRGWARLLLGALLGAGSGAPFLLAAVPNTPATLPAPATPATPAAPGRVDPARAATPSLPAAPTPVRPRGARASSTWGQATAALAIDGVIEDGSRWISQKSTAPAWLEIDLGQPQALSGVHLYSGYQQKQPLRDFAVQFWREGAWHTIPSAQVAGNRAVALAVAFDDTVRVVTDRLRLWITGTDDGAARVLEVVVWPAAPGGMPSLQTESARIPLLYLNQSGFNRGAPKRFTAPTLPDGTRFEVRAAAGGPPLFSGTLQGHVGDFTAFDPTGASDYVVVAGPHTSVPFRIGDWWLERVTYQNAVNFMIDSRHHVGNWRAPCRGSFGWRDDHHFGFELHTLVPQWLSHPSAYARLPRQIRAELPPPAAPGAKPLWGRLAPAAADAPDLVKLIHWGADVIVSQEATHELLKSQLAYFLYAWPWLEAYLPAQNYAVVRDFAFAHWSDATCDREYPHDETPRTGHDLLALKTAVGTTKGAYPPGFSVQPNLLLYEVARREGRPDAERYFAAAQRQAAWMIAHLDWNDPLTTKGQRMSEWVTVTGLAHLLSHYADRAPAGLAAKLEAWADVVIRRADNLWDFRRLDDGTRWTPMGEKPTMWNEPGNVVGLPAALLAAQPHVAAAGKRARLGQLVWSHFDNAFGRNPAGRHFSYDAPREIEGVEFGWYSFHHGGIGQLADARFVLDGAPKNGHYPYHPEVGNIGWTEGWVQFNTAFNLSLAYLAHSSIRLTAQRTAGDLVVQLEAPLNFDPARVETGEVQVRWADGRTASLTVAEDGPNARRLLGRIQIPDTKAAAGPVAVTYGYGYFAVRAEVPAAR